MAVVYTENATHRAAILAAEVTRQVAQVGATAAQLKAADIAFHRACLASAISNSCGTAQFSTALQELGVGGH